jgi:hypothetical protein
METNDFIQFWKKLTKARRGAAVEAFFKWSHDGASLIHSGSVDFDYDGSKYDIKSNQNACPQLNKVQKENGISILWYNWSRVSTVDGCFPITKISWDGKQIVKSEWKRCGFNEFGDFIKNFKTSKKSIRETDSKIHSEQDITKKKTDWAEANIHPLFNKLFPGKNRFGLRDIATKKFGPSVGPVLLNHEYQSHDRSIILFYEDESNSSENLKLVIKKWWLFEHDKPAEQMKLWLEKHSVGNKYYCTQKAFDRGLVREYKNVELRGG